MRQLPHLPHCGYGPDCYNYFLVDYITTFSARSIALKECYLMMNFEENSLYSFSKIGKNTDLMVKPLQNVTF